MQLPGLLMRALQCCSAPAARANSVGPWVTRTHVDSAVGTLHATTVIDLLLRAIFRTWILLLLSMKSTPQIPMGPKNFASVSSRTLRKLRKFDTLEDDATAHRCAHCLQAPLDLHTSVYLNFVSFFALLNWDAVKSVAHWAEQPLKPDTFSKGFPCHHWHGLSIFA